jgi:hypothetical protein
MSSIAVFVALGGSATAATLVVTGRDVRDGSLTGRDIKNGSLTRADLAAGTLRSVGDPGPKGENGTAGPKGESGPQGAKGEAGATGASGERGAAGLAGAQGDRGPKGETGERGPKGDPGASALSFIDATYEAAPAFTNPKGPLWTHEFTLPRAGKVFVHAQNWSVTATCRWVFGGGYCGGSARFYVDGAPLATSTGGSLGWWIQMCSGCPMTLNYGTSDAKNVTGVSGELAAGPHLLAVRYEDSATFNGIAESVSAQVQDVTILASGS